MPADCEIEGIDDKSLTILHKIHNLTLVFSMLESRVHPEPSTNDKFVFTGLMMDYKLTVHLRLAALVCFMALMPARHVDAQETRPDPLDPYAVEITAISNSPWLFIQGQAGSIEADETVWILNRKGSVLAAASNEGNGSFFASVPGNRGDLLVMYVRNASGLWSDTGTVFYADAFTIKNPYQNGGSWYVGQGHFHTKASDGRNWPFEMEAAYFDAGYDFVVSTDHRGISPNYLDATHGMTSDPVQTTKNLLWISGSEISTGGVHLGSWGQASRVPFSQIVDVDPQTLVDGVRNLGGIAVMNHPENFRPGLAWAWQTEIDVTRGMSLIEAFNGQHPPEQEGSEHRIDAIDLADGFRQVWWLGTDDCHDMNNQDSFNSYAMIVQTDSEAIDADDILASADSGRLYIRETSSGPEIESVGVVGNTIRLTLADEPSNYQITWRMRGDVIARFEPNVDIKSIYTVTGDEGYVRAEVLRLDDGTQAYTQPIFIGNSKDLSVSASDSALVDNDSATVWDAGTTTGDVVVDVGSMRQLNAIKINWDAIGNSRFNYRIDASADGQFSGEETELVRNTRSNRLALTTDFFDVYARYIRVQITGQSVGISANARIREIEIFDASPERTQLFLDNVNGDDENTGLSGSPWLTFAHASTMMRPRDTLNFVRTGVPYSGRHEIRAGQSGKHSGATVEFSGDPALRTEIDGSGYNYAVRFTNAQFVEWHHFDIHSATDANVFVVSVNGPGTIIHRNRIHNSEHRGVLWSAIEGTFEYNLVYDNLGEGIFLYKNGTGAKIFNNVAYNNQAAGIRMHNIHSISVTVQNNISANNAGPALQSGPNVSLTDSHNCVLGDYAGDWSKIGNVDADPLFVDAANRDFRLQADSPCIDAGIDLDAPTDFLGAFIHDTVSVPNTGDPGAFWRNYIDIGGIEHQDPPDLDCYNSCHQP